ncbi:GNAT family N-acetyltransferase [Roseovarius faecimaris]|uniref:GNAT family N-acetyltransferase n=1 Tax=Roseovarius faecimaris TaxID=2494550 RepID=A0A6I6IU16_9RHOB|nr:GNAT family N-acetyltransferase [Roseovarius faecimaris]QGX98987.1 GNAT family N-acetyltransferase [Roseovarius faecimaris]
MTLGLVLSPLPRSQVQEVAHLKLPGHQRDFVGDIAEMTDEPDLIQDFHIARAGTEAVGFFKIDRDFSRRIARLPAGAHALRGLLIGGQYQGRGYGHALLSQLGAYVAGHYDIDALWLSVDESNAAAATLYGRCGWHIEGAPHQGRVGPEIVMRLPAR